MLPRYPARKGCPIDTVHSMKSQTFRISSGTHENQVLELSGLFHTLFSTLNYFNIEAILSVFNMATVKMWKHCIKTDVHQSKRF